MKRRDALRMLAGAALGWPPAARAQAPKGVPHIGYLNIGSADVNGVFLDALRAGLREYGYLDGKNIVIDVRWAAGEAPTLPGLATALVKEKPAAIVTTCITTTLAAKDATRTIPVVMSIDGDPVAAGLVESLARPGANVTGTSTNFEDLIPKWLELLSAAAPKAREIAILRNPVNVIDPYFWSRFEENAKALRIKALPFEASEPAALEATFADIGQKRAGAIVVMTEGFFTSQAPRIVPLVDRYRLPAIYGFREFAEAGGLMSYGVSYRDYFRNVARYVDAVLKGAKPADLPVAQPEKIELVINAATAKRQGVALPPTLMARADRVLV